MNITLFTCDKKRHNYLINKLSNISKTLFVVQEYHNNTPKQNFIKNSNDEGMNKYFANVQNAEIKIFMTANIDVRAKRILSCDFELL